MPHRHFAITNLDALFETGVFPGTGVYPLGDTPFFFIFSLPSAVGCRHMASNSYAHAFLQPSASSTSHDRRDGRDATRRDGRCNRRA